MFYWLYFSIYSLILYQQQYVDIPFKEIGFNFIKEYRTFIVFGFHLIVILIILILLNRRKSIMLIDKEIKLDNVSELRQKNSLYLLGDFKVYDRNAVDITKELSPKIKQLFILLIIRSYFGPTHGITKDSLTTYLWPDLSADNAKNNRNVSINKLRGVISKLDGIQINYNKNEWSIVIDHKVYCDLIEYKNTLEDMENDVSNVTKMKEILLRGELLQEENYEWFDPIKAQLVEESIRILQKCITTVKHQPEIMVKIADTILLLDTVNETGLTIKINALIRLGNHSLAKATFELFQSEYYRLYAEDYKKTYSSFLKEELI